MHGDSVVRVEADADGGRDEEFVPVDTDGRAQGIEYLGGQLAGHGLVILQGQDDHEFVATEPCHRIVGAQGIGQAAGHLLEQGVADMMAQRVVDGLEAVQINEQDGQLGVILGSGIHGLAEALLEQRAVGQAGQCIVVGEIAQLALDAATFQYFAFQFAGPFLDPYFQFVARAKQGVLGLLAFGNVVGDEEETLGLVIFAMQGGDGQFDSEAGAVLALESPFALVDRTQPDFGQQGIDGIRRTETDFLGQQVMPRLKFLTKQEAIDGRPADQFRTRKAQHLFGGRIAGNDLPEVVGGQDHQLGAVENGALQHDRLAQRILRHLARGNVFEVPDRSLVGACRVDGSPGHAHPDGVAVAATMDDFGNEGFAPSHDVVAMLPELSMGLVGKVGDAGWLAGHFSRLVAIQLFETPIDVLENAIADEGDADHAMIEDQALVDIGLPQVFLGLLEGCAVFEQPEDALRRITGIGSVADQVDPGLGAVLAPHVQFGVEGLALEQEGGSLAVEGFEFLGGAIEHDTVGTDGAICRKTEQVPEVLVVALQLAVPGEGDADRGIGHQRFHFARRLLQRIAGADRFRDVFGDPYRTPAVVIGIDGLAEQVAPDQSAVLLA